MEDIMDNFKKTPTDRECNRNAILVNRHFYEKFLAPKLNHQQIAGFKEDAPMKLTVLDLDSNKSYDFQLSFRVRGPNCKEYELGKGWRQFVADNGVKGDDVIVFEWVDSPNMVIGARRVPELEAPATRPPGPAPATRPPGPAPTPAPTPAFDLFMRSYIKQHDKKSLSRKALLAEVKEIREQKCKDDGTLCANVTGDRRPIISHMEFEYPDTEIHEDLFLLMKYSCEKVCTREQLNKVTKIWTLFLESVFGVLSLAQVGNDSKTVPKVKNEAYGSDDHATGDIDESSSLGRLSYSNHAKEDELDAGSGELHQISEQRNSNLVDQISGAVTLSNDGMATSVVSPTAVTEKLCGKNVDNSSGLSTMQLRHGSPSDDNSGHEFRPNAGNALLSEPVDSTRTVAVTDGGVSKEVRNCQGVHDDNAEREEDEISPYRDFDEDNLAVEDAATEFANKHDHGSSSGQQQSRQQGDLAHDGDNNAVDEGDDSIHKSSEESENASENGNVSVSDFGDGEDNRAESEGEAEEMVDAQEGDESLLPSSSNGRIKGSRIFYGNDAFYVLFRLHQTLYERIQLAKINASVVADTKRKSSSDADPSDRYLRFLNALYDLVDGTSDNTKFEDDCLTIIGPQSYVLFTLDKLIHKLLEQLQILASDDINNQLLQLYAYESSINPERFLDNIYHDNARVIVKDKNIYRIECSSSPTRLSVQLMEKGRKMTESSIAVTDPNLSAYLQNDFFSDIADKKETSGVFLRRNKRKHASGEEISLV